MSRTPLFSTYRQGENRVTSSLLAVFERIALDLVERLVGAVVGESSLQLVNFTNQSGRGGLGVPDAQVSARFRFLFEVKTVRGAIAGDVAEAQLRRHLDRLDGSYGDERLFVLTPDGHEPELLKALSDRRVRWLSFHELAQAIEEVLDDPAEPADERDRYLLRELLALFYNDVLLATDDTVIVAAREAYGYYLRHGAYICQANRSFKPDLARLGFYLGKEIRPELPSILARRKQVLFSPDEAERLEVDGGAEDAGLAAVIREALLEGDREEDTSHDVFLLSPPDDPRTLLLAQAVAHVDRGAWTQQQRYTSVERLRSARTTRDLRT
jgi:hypothetical protein